MKLMDLKFMLVEIIIEPGLDDESEYEFEAVSVREFDVNKEFISEFMKQLKVGRRFVIGVNGTDISQIEDAERAIIFKGPFN